MNKSRLAVLFSLMAIVSMALASCATPTPQVIIQTQIVPQVQTQIVPQVQTQVVVQTAAPVVQTQVVMQTAAPVIQTQVVVQTQIVPMEIPTATGKRGVFYFIQNTAWHPVHQLMQQSFLDGCRKLGLACQLATTDEGSLEAWVAVAKQALARPDAAGFVMYAGGNPVIIPLVQKAKDQGQPVAEPHFHIPQGTFADNYFNISEDVVAITDPVAKGMCDELVKQGKDSAGSVAITINNHNTTEDAMAGAYKAAMNKYCPKLKVLDVVLEGPEPTQAIAAAVSIIQANPDIVAGFSTTGGGPTTWAGAQDQTGKQVLAVGMDYTQVNLDLVKNGKVYGIVAQPIYDEMSGSAKLVYDMANGKKVPYWTVLPAPLVTKADVGTYQAILDRLSVNFRAAINPDTLRATPTPKK
jgi:ribose transport system substrate-binding protein